MGKKKFKTQISTPRHATTKLGSIDDLLGGRTYVLQEPDVHRVHSLTNNPYSQLKQNENTNLNVQ